MADQYTITPNTIKDRGLSEIVKSQAEINKAMASIKIHNPKFKFRSYQYQGRALDTVAWFMYGVKPVKDDI